MNILVKNIVVCRVFKQNERDNETVRRIRSSSSDRLIGKIYATVEGTRYS